MNLQKNVFKAKYFEILILLKFNTFTLKNKNNFACIKYKYFINLTSVNSIFSNNKFLFTFKRRNLMGSAWLYWLTLIVVGFLAAGSKIAAKNPDAGKALNVLVPFQGIIGIWALIYGIIQFIDALKYLDWLEYVPVAVLTGLASTIIMIILGFLLGYSLIMKFVGGATEEAKAKFAATQAKLAGAQSTLGYLAILLAIWHIIQYYAEIVA